jgi:peptidoglycan L-alanyl-D-glutamate endopeptidase CwlK
MGTLTAEGKQALLEVSAEFGIRPSDLLAIMLYETSWTLDPDKSNGLGPRQGFPNGPYIGLIQFGEKERRDYGYRPGMTQAEQIRGPVRAYIQDRLVNWYHDRGLVPVVNLETLYTTILGGNPGNTKGDINGTLSQHFKNIREGFWPAARLVLVGTDVNPALLAVVSRAKEIMPSGMSFGVYPTGGTRTEEEQAALVRAGWSKTMNSDHLDGNSIDLIPIDVATGKAYPDDLVRYEYIRDAMQQASKELGIDVEWGGNWSGFPDRPHFALKNPEQKLPPQYDPLSGKLVPRVFSALPIIQFSPKMQNELFAARFPGIRPASFAPSAEAVPTPPTRGRANNVLVADMEGEPEIGPASPILPAHVTVPQKVAPDGRSIRTEHDLREHSYHGVPGRPWTKEEADQVLISRFNINTAQRPDLQNEFSSLSIERPSARPPVRMRVQGGAPPERPVGSLPMSPMWREAQNRRPSPAPPRLRPSTVVSLDVLGARKDEHRVPEYRPRPSTAVPLSVLGARTDERIRPQLSFPVRNPPPPGISRIRITGAAGGGVQGSVGEQKELPALVPEPRMRIESPLEKMKKGVGLAFDNGRVVLRPVVGVRPEVPGDIRPKRVKLGPVEISVGQPEGFRAVDQGTIRPPGAQRGPDPILPGEIRGGTSSTDATGQRIVVQKGAEIRSPQPGALSGIESRPPPEVRRGREITEPRISTVSSTAPRNPDYNEAPRVYIESRTKDDKELPFVTLPTIEEPPEPRPRPTIVEPEVEISPEPEFVPPHIESPSVEVGPGGVLGSGGSREPAEIPSVPPPPTMITKPRPPPKVTFNVKPPPIRTSSRTYTAPGYRPSGSGLQPPGFTPTGRITFGSNAIANSASGGPRYTYQTGQSPTGQSTVSWVDSRGNTRTAYTDPSQMGGGFIHQGSVTF